MRLALVVNTYPPRTGGLETHVSHLGAALTDTGHEVHVLTLGEQAGTRTDHGIRVVTGRCHLHVKDVITFPTVGATRMITSYLRSHRIELVSTHTRFFPMSYVGVRAAQGARVPVIHTEHGSDFVVSSDPAVFLGSRAVDLTMGRYVLRHAQRVLAVSPQAAAFAERLGAPKAEVFYNAVPAPQPRERPVADRPEHLVFVGRIVPGKGWDTFLEAVAALRSQGRRITGEMLGSGAQLDQARRRVSELGLEQVVSLRGWVQPEEVHRALAGATLVNPTILAEGFQTTLLEAVGDGGRVVTFDVPGAALLAEQGAPVVVCPERTTAALTTAVSRMLDDLPAPGGPDLITPWTWPVRARQYAHIAEQVIEQYRGL